MSEPKKPENASAAAAAPPVRPGSPWPRPAPPPPRIEPGADKDKPAKVDEVGGPEGPEPTRYGDWAIKGRVSDF